MFNENLKNLKMKVDERSKKIENSLEIKKKEFNKEWNEWHQPLKIKRITTKQKKENLYSNIKICC